MKKFAILLCSLVLVFGVVATVSAIPYTDVFEANRKLSTGQSIGWTFVLDNFNPDTQDITSARIELNLADDANCDFWEFANLRVGENRFIWEVDTGTSSFNVSSLVSLSETGMVAARLTAILGDFWFKNATLYADGTDPGGGSTPVPEPGTILLLGSSLLGLVIFNRKRFNTMKN